jgi:long-chain acyl-CoA synthetase
MMLAVPLIIEKLFKTRILPGIRRHLVTRLLYRLPAARKRIHLTAGRRLERLLGGELRFFGIGGASLSPTVERFLRDAGFPYAVGYGLTETAPLLTGCGPKHTRYRSAGPPVPGVEIRIAKPHAATGIGEIQARGAPVMQGYYKDPERTAAAFTPDGWFRTGDLGRIDPGGYLYITGRLKNVIVGPSGENIYPEAVESVIHRSELVLESLVYEEDGHIVARVHLDYEKLDEQFTSERLSESQARARIARLLEEIRRATNAQVASFSRLSRIIEQMEPFEKTPTLKIKRHLYVSKKPDL